MEQLKDAQTTPSPAQANGSQPVENNALPKFTQIKRTTLIINIVVIVFSLVICVLMMFAPIFKVGDRHLKNSTQNISSLEYFFGFADISSNEPYQDHINQTDFNFEKDLEFKREYKPTAFRSFAYNIRDFIIFLKFHYLTPLYESIHNRNIPEDQKTEYIEATNEKMNKDLEILYPLYDMFCPEIMRMNYPGLKMFLGRVEAAYKTDSLNEELFKEYEDTYLVFQNYKLQPVKQYFEDLSKLDPAEHSFSSVTDPMPSYDDMYQKQEIEDQSGNKKIVYEETSIDLYGPIQYDLEEEDMGAEACLAFTFLFAFSDLILLLATIYFIMRVVKEQKSGTIVTPISKKLVRRGDIVFAMIFQLLCIIACLIIMGVFNSVSTLYLGVAIPVIIMILMSIGGRIACKKLTKKYTLIVK